MVEYDGHVSVSVVHTGRARHLWISWNDLDNGLLVAADDNADDALRIKGNTVIFRCDIQRLRVRTMMETLDVVRWLTMSGSGDDGTDGTDGVPKWI